VVPLDCSFVVRSSSPPAWVRAFFETRAIRNAVTAATPYAIAVEAGRVRARREGVEEDAASLTRIVRIVSTMAERATDMNAEWTRVAHVLGGSVRRGIEWQRDAQVVIVRAQMSMTLSLSIANDAITTSLSIDHPIERDVPDVLRSKCGPFSLPQGQPASMV